MQLDKLELLAPARNIDIGIAAINCGAEAVYIAGPSFGARESADNSIEDIAALVRYAHRYRVKVYMVLNTILFQNEIEQAEKITHQAYNAGCDALIIQDMGLLSANIAPLPLFASTQTYTRTPEDAVLMEKLGFKRVILARELSLSQIKEIREASKIELESFVHGSLCVGYSGRCYLSAALTGRSANRGVCAQPCRSYYNLVDKNGKVLRKNEALLSLKDLNLTTHIPSLAEAGVTSFKIEGRLKNISYVKNIVRHYRSVIDSLIREDGRYEKASLGTLYDGFTPNPYTTFNRGYTTLFIDGERGHWKSEYGTKSLGEYIGKVNQTWKNKSGEYSFEYNPEIKLSNNDGLCFGSPKGKIIGAKVSGSDSGKVATTARESIPEDSGIYRNYNHKFEKELTNEPERLLRVTLKFFCREGKTTIDAVCEDGSNASFSITGDYPEAQNRERARSIIIAQLSRKSGIYNFSEPEVLADTLLLYPLSVLNNARRCLAEDLQKASETTEIREISERQDVEDVTRAIKDKPFSGKRIGYTYNIANKLSEELYLKLGADSADVAFEISRPARAELLRSKYCIRYELGICLKQPGADKVDAPLYLENNGNRMMLGFDCDKCEMIIFG